MGTAGGTTTQLQHWLVLLREGHGEARTELLAHAGERLRKLARRMLRGFPLVRRWEQTDDVLQNALIRLYRALADVAPDSVLHFYRLAALAIRRELIDLAKHHARGDSRLDHAADASLDTVVDRGDEPATLLEWSEFHQQVEALPDEEREVFSLLWYEGLTQAEAAEVLGVAVRTVIRRWQEARIRLRRRALFGEPLDGSSR